MDVSDLDVVVWCESEEREAWWRQIVGAGIDDDPGSACQRRITAGAARGIVRL
jgi:hypothetical protein